MASVGHLCVCSGGAGGHLEHDGAQQRDELPIDLARIFTRLERSVDDVQSTTGVAVGQRIRQLDHALATGDAQESANICGGNRTVDVAGRLLPVGCQLIEQPKRIPQAATGMLAR